jgi:hypothetical protein
MSGLPGSGRRVANNAGGSGAAPGRGAELSWQRVAAPRPGGRAGYMACEHYGGYVHVRWEKVVADTLWYALCCL